MHKSRSRAIPIVVILLFLLMLIQVPSGESILTGPVVDVNISGQMIEAGDSTTVTVLVENFDGESSTPMDLIEVTLSVTLGTFEPETAITDVGGYCQFTYYAPSEIEGSTDVTITATAETGALDTTGNDEVTVTYRLVGQVLGPAQVLAGGEAVGYIVRVTADGSPVPNANVMPTVFGSGTLGTRMRQTNATGEATLTIHPGDSPGQITILVQLGSQDYMSSAVSRIINVVDELDPLEIQVPAFPRYMKNWASRRINARAIRGSDPVGGISVHFTTSAGYFIDDEVVTDQSGNATGIFIASPLVDDQESYDVTINISTNDGAEWAFFEDVQNVEGIPVELGFAFSALPLWEGFNGQLFPGEYLVHEPKIRYDDHPNSFVADMSLEFQLLNSDGEIAYSKVIAMGLDTLLFEDGRYDYIYKPGSITVYEVPADPIDGNYTWRYYLTDRTGSHQYCRFRSIVPRNGALVDFPISIHSEGADDWTFMYYFAGDNDLAPYMDYELEYLENNAPDGEFKVYVFFDRDDDYDHIRYYNGHKWKGAMIWDLEVGRENGIGPVTRNSGSAANLLDFMKWVSYYSPSGHYGLVLSDHGKGYKGMCYDQEGDRSYAYLPFDPGYSLDPDDIRSVLRQYQYDRRRVEVVTLAACGMSTIEVATRVGPYTDYIVASQQPTYSEHGLTTEKVLEHLKGYDWDLFSPNAFQVASDFVNGFTEESGGTDHDSTVSVIRTDAVKDLASEINETMRTIYNNWDLLGESFSTAYEQTTRTPGPELGEFENGDLKEFLINLRTELADFILDLTGRSAFNSAQDSIGLFDDLVVYSHLIDGLNGLNLYMPTEPIPIRSIDYTMWDYNGIWQISGDYYVLCLNLHSGGDYYPRDGDGEEEDDPFTPLDPVRGHIIDDDNDGLGNTVVINLTPGQDNRGQPFRVVIDCLQFSGKGSGYLSDMLKKRIILGPEDIGEALTQIQVGLPVSGSYTVMARILGENNEILQKYIVGIFSMEATDPEGAPPELHITASTTKITVGDELHLNVGVSDPDGDDVDLIWDFDHRDGIFFDYDEESPSTRYIKPGNVTVTCIATDGEYTVVETFEIVVEPAVGNNPPSAGIISAVDETGVVKLFAEELSSDPDGDELQYCFNFGDGNWTEWIDYDWAEHHYSQIGDYNCSVRVRDIKGAVSERFFLMVNVRSVQNKTGEVGDDDESFDSVALLIIILIIAVIAVVVILAGAVLVIFLVMKRKKDTDEEGGEEVETW